MKILRLEQERLIVAAYNYAKRRGKTRQDIIDVYIDGHRNGERYVWTLSTVDILEALKERFRTIDEINYDLGMSDARREPNETEIRETEIREEFEKFISVIKEYTEKHKQE